MPYYEQVLVTRPDISPQQVEALIEDVEHILQEHKGRVDRNEYWGLRNLAYPIKKQRKGHYAFLNIEAPVDAMSELDRRLRINDDVMRYLTIRVDELSDKPSPIVARKDRDDRKPRDGDGGRN